MSDPVERRVSRPAPEQLLAQADDFLKARQFGLAESCCRQILLIDPQHAGALHMLGRISHKLGRPEMAQGFIRKALQTDPDVALYHLTLGRVQLALGKLGEAVASFQRAIELDPSMSKAYVNLGAALLLQRDESGAVVSLRKALELNPGNQAAHLDLGLALMGQGDEAAALSFRRAIELDPNEPSAYANLGVLLMQQGKEEEALANFRQALALDPTLHSAHSNLLFVLHYLPDYSREKLLAAACQWAEQHGVPQMPEIQAPAAQELPDRRLRVGYVSADFHRHPVGYFLEPVLSQHDKTQVEVFCYSNSGYTDDLTSRLRDVADHWRNLVGVSDDEAAARIRRDEIDILVDLSGHTAGHRLGIFARKPAPVQATWLGYFDTTGLPAMDYIVADRYLCPEDDDQWYVEKVIRLPHSYLCYTPQDAAPVAPLPALSRGYITFGCFNKIAKINPSVIALWSEILRILPDARICLKDAGFDNIGVRKQYLDVFASKGIATDRVILLPRSSFAEYLNAYGTVDIGLDPFPFNGGTTTVETLWMGVPVITLAGDRYVSRMGVSHLSSVGLEELVATSPADYVQKAVGLARDTDRLAGLRTSLRQKMLQSELCNAQRFTQGLEAAYRDMWRAWCCREPASASFVSNDNFMTRT